MKKHIYYITILVMILFIGCSKGNVENAENADEVDKHFSIDESKMLKDKILLETLEDNKDDKNNNESKAKNVQSINLERTEGIYNNPIIESVERDQITISTYIMAGTSYYYSYGYDETWLTTDEVVVGEDAISRNTLRDLESDKIYQYKLHYKEAGTNDYIDTESFIIHLMPIESKSFNFIIEADPHFDNNSSAKVYKDSLASMIQHNPSFIMDLGDVSMVEKLTDNEEDLLDRYELVRSFWDDIGHLVPFYMVLGNHDGEAAWNYGGKDPIGQLASESRRSFLPTVELDEVYDGLSDTIYSFTWGAVQIIALNPFAYTEEKPKGENWKWTLGLEQYEWLENTLEESNSKYKFVFIHNLIGGIGKANRGGVEGAIYHEWGGYNEDGIYEFEEERPDMSMPIHDLLVKHEVDIVFHGHDHFYAKETLDGIIYQLVPQPSLENAQDALLVAEQQGYKDGEFLPSPGYLKVSVTDQSAIVEYIKSETGDAITSYEISGND